MPLPAGTGLTRRRFVIGSLGAALAVYGGSQLGLRAFEEGIAAAATGPAAPILVSVFLEGGADGLSVLSPQGDPLYTKLRPDSSRSPAAPRSPRTTASTGIRRSAGCSSSTRRRRSRCCPAVGYTHPDQSHFTSRHYWEVGATEANLRTGWLGRYLDRVGKKDNPLQGLSLDDTLAPALATAKVPVASISGPDQYDFYSEPRLGRGRAADARGDRAAGPPARGRRAADRRRRRDAGRPPAPAAHPVPVVERDHEPRARIRSRTTRSRRGSQGSPRCSPPGCRSTASR